MAREDDAVPGEPIYLTCPRCGLLTPVADACCWNCLHAHGLPADAGGLPAEAHGPHVDATRRRPVPPAGPRERAGSYVDRAVRTGLKP